MLSCFSHVQLFATPWTVVRQAPLSRGDSPGKNTGVGGHFLLQGIFQIQRLNPLLFSLAFKAMVEMFLTPVPHQPITFLTTPRGTCSVPRDLDDFSASIWLSSCHLLALGLCFCISAINLNETESTFRRQRMKSCGF